MFPYVTAERLFIKQIMKRNWNIILSDVGQREVFPEPSGVSFQHLPTIKDKLVQRYLPAEKQGTWLKKPNGSFPCGQGNYCVFMLIDDVDFFFIACKCFSCRNKV